MIIKKRDRLAIWASGMIAKAQAKLHVSPEPLVRLNYSIVDNNGKVLERIEGKSHSVLNNYYAICAATGLIPPRGTEFYAGNGMGAIEVLSTASVWYYTVPISNVGTAGIGTAGDTTLGIVLGNGAGGWSFISNYAMSGLIAHGSGLNQVYYQAQSKVSSWDSGTRTWNTKIFRGFANNSDATITLTEVGLIENVYIAAAGTAVKVLLVRDILDIGFTIDNNRALIVEYLFTYQFP
jgi:hypothetical protein